MDDRNHFDTITFETFTELLAQYPDVVPAKMEKLDEQRLYAIPKIIHQRELKFITKDELSTLMQWKLSHGKFRATLQRLVDSNDVMTVKTTAIETFRKFPDARSGPPSVDDMKRLMTSLTSRLKGVGPATATLLLNCYDQVHVPFFSDELFLWALWDAEVKGSKTKAGTGTGWLREVSYTPDAYLQMYSRVVELQKRLSAEAGKPVRAVDVECVAYVLGRSAKEQKKRRGSADVAADGVKPPVKKKRRAAAESETVEEEAKPAVRKKRKAASEGEKVEDEALKPPPKQKQKEKQASLESKKAEGGAASPTKKPTKKMAAESEKPADAVEKKKRKRIKSKALSPPPETKPADGSNINTPAQEPDGRAEKQVDGAQ